MATADSANNAFRLRLHLMVADQLQAGDANQDFSFDQSDIGPVFLANKYLTGEPATWGEGDWNGAPGGSLGNPPSGDGVFDQKDLVAALASVNYLEGPYAAIIPEPAPILLLLAGTLNFARYLQCEWPAKATCAHQDECP